MRIRLIIIAPKSERNQNIEKSVFRNIKCDKNYNTNHFPHEHFKIQIWCKNYVIRIDYSYVLWLAN